MLPQLNVYDRYMGKTDPIYIDYAASSPLDPRVQEVIHDVSGLVGNPSSIHSFGRVLRARIDEARDQVARLLEVNSGELFFTSGATEGNTNAILGISRSMRAEFGSERSLRILSSPLEHSSVVSALKVVQDECDIVVDLLPVDKQGRVSADDMNSMLTDDTFLVCVMWANNVLGTVQPVREIGKALQEAKKLRPTGELPLYFLCDAVQAARTISVLPNAIKADVLTVSGHKIYGPRGIGAIFMKKNARVAPLIPGGGQESGMRGGTENFTGIVGLGRAAEILKSERDKDAVHVRKLRQILAEGLRSFGPKARVLSPEEGGAVPGILFAHFPGNDSESLALKMDVGGVAISTGSACDSGTRKSSSMIRVVYGDRVAGDGGLRFSFGRFTEESDIERVLSVLKSSV